MAIRVALAIRNEEKAAPYRRAVEMAGMEPVTFIRNCGESLDRAAGLMLTGGTDVDPALYGTAPGPETGKPDRQRDDYESELLRTALERNMPVLAICRGLQLLNVVCGGTLIQHLPNTEKHRQKTGGSPVHEVAVEGRLREILGAPKAWVNSRHHQAADRIGAGLAVIARDSEDGAVEGLEFPAARFALAVQWHPEDMLDDERQMRLFSAFRDAAANRGY